jgi:flagellar hook assembly protein FlgD
LTRPARAVFALLLAATFAAFFAAQRVKGAPPVVQVAGLDRYFSPNGDGRKDVNRFRLRMRAGGDVTVDVVDRAGDEVRRLVDGATVAPSRPLRLRWNGRTDAGTRAPDGDYRMRVTLQEEGRSVTVPRTTRIDTRPPRPRVAAIAPGPIVGPGPVPVRIRFGAVSRRAATRLVIYRTDEGDPRPVAELRQEAGKRSVEWDGVVEGRPAPPGVYLVQVTTRDRAGNVGSTPREMPPVGPARGHPGLTIRAIAAAPPLRPVTAGDRVTINVDARRLTYRWRLRRIGRSRPVATGREPPGEPVELTAPDGDSGIYVLELRSGEHTTAVPLLVQARERADVLVVVPALTWVGTTAVDQDDDGMPNTLDAGSAVDWPRVFPDGLPADLTDRVAPLLVHLDRASIRYDLTSDLDLALAGGPRATDREGVLLAGAQRWAPRGYARRLRRYVADGGRLASFGTESLRRGVTLLRDEAGARGRLVRPTQPSPQDPFGTRFEPVRREPEPVTLTPIAGDASHPLLTGFDGALGGFSVLEEGEAERVVTALGRETVAPEEDPGVPEELPPPALPALAATRVGDGLMIRVGLPGWPARLGDPEVDQLTRNVFDVLAGRRPKPR